LQTLEKAKVDSTGECSRAFDAATKVAQTQLEEGTKEATEVPFVFSFFSPLTSSYFSLIATYFLVACQSSVLGGAGETDGGDRGGELLEVVAGPRDGLEGAGRGQGP